MEEMVKAYDAYITALADKSVDTDTLEALYDKWCEVALINKGRD